MGMAASQVRFLSLQNRKNSIGRQLSTLANRKTSLARDMKNVSRNFTNALNQTHLKWSNDCGATYHNLSYDMLMKPNDVNAAVPYILTNANTGRVVLNDSPIIGIDGKPLVAGSTGLKMDDGTVLVEPNGNISYLTIAKMISSFNTIKDGVPKYDSHSATKPNGGVVQLPGGVNFSEDGRLVGSPAKTDAYFIPGAKDFDFKNNLRYQIFSLMGLITKEQVQEQNSLLVQLYGSQEAKDSGVYPIGSAWGDYYIAQANLEAYEDFISRKQSLSTANTYGNSDKTTVDLNEKSANYAYNTNINGENGTSSITQTDGGSNGQGSSSHVNFTSIIDKNAEGYYEVTDSAGHDLSGYTTNFANNGIGYTTTITGDGLKHIYTVDDILTSALNAYGDVSDSDNLKWLAAENPDATGNYASEDRYIVVYEGDREYYIGHNDVYGRCQPKLYSICDSFISLLNKNTITKLDSEALKKAKEQTTYIFANNMLIKDTDSCEQRGGHVTEQAKLAAENYNAVSINHQQIHYHFPATFHGARIRAAVDAQAMFNTFMSYYNFYLQNPNEPYYSDDTSAHINPTGIPISFDEDSASATSSVATYGSKKFINSQVIGQDGNGKDVVALTRNELTTTSTDGSGSAVYIWGTTYSETPIPGVSGGDTAYYAKNNGDASLVYYKDKSATTLYIDDSHPSVSVYGTLSKGDDTYYFLTQNALTRYITNNEINDSEVYKLSGSSNSNGTSYPITLQDGEVHNSVDAVVLKKYAGSTKYCIDIDGLIAEDEAYKSKLEQAVEAARERIGELEEELENFYGDADQKIMDYYDALFLRIANEGWEQDEHTSNQTYLNNKIQNNDFFLTECLQKNSNTGFNYTAKQATNVIKVFTVHDDSAENEALAEYEAKKSEIQYKENIIDTRMAKLETEQEAINTEMEGIEKVRNDNIQKYFKIFA